MKKGVGKGQVLVPPSNHTINQEVPLLLRRVYNRAKFWKVDLGEEINWNGLMLRASRERVRDMNEVEEKALFEALREDFHPVIRFALATGLRRSQLLVKKFQMHWKEGLLVYEKKSVYTDHKGYLPISTEMARILKEEIAKGDPNREEVFTFIAQQSRKGMVKGERYPIQMDGLIITLRRAVKRAEIENWRLFHDFRHTAATRTYRDSKDFKAVQVMLGHSSITQKEKYAHALLDDVRAAMEAGRR